MATEKEVILIPLESVGTPLDPRKGKDVGSRGSVELKPLVYPCRIPMDAPHALPDPRQYQDPFERPPPFKGNVPVWTMDEATNVGKKIRKPRHGKHGKVTKKCIIKMYW